MPVTSTVFTPTVSATLNGTALVGVRKARVISSFADPVTKIYCTVYPAITYSDGDTLAVTMGSGTNNVLSGTGQIYESDYLNAGPTFELVARGPLFKAQQYTNNKANGLTLDDLTGGPATDEVIARAVLDVVGITYSVADIGGTGLQRGALAPAAYTWRQGETALQYLQRLGKASLGYRMVETIGGAVTRVKVVGRPTSTATYSLTQGVDVLAGGHTQYDASGKYSAITVTGYDYGDGNGAVSFSYPNPTPTGIAPYVYSSEMIERAFIQDDGSGVAASTVGMSFVLPEVNRTAIRVTGIKTPRDDLFEPGQTHQINSAYLGLTNTLLWCMAVTRECDDKWFTQTMEYIGGGTASDGTVLPTGLSTFIDDQSNTAEPIAPLRARDYTWLWPHWLVSFQILPIGRSTGRTESPPRGPLRARDYTHFHTLLITLRSQDEMITGDQVWALPTYRRNQVPPPPDMPPASNLLLPFTLIGTTTSITNAVGTTAVYTFASPPAGVSIGSVVTVTGATPSVYNVSAASVTNVAGNTFSVDIGSSGNGDASVQGVAVLL